MGYTHRPMLPTQSYARKLHSLLVTVAVLIVAADQLTKAYCVYHFGTHPAQSFIQFLGDYYKLWGKINGNGVISVIHSHYFPFQPHFNVWDPWIRFTLTTNSGAAWSILTGKSFLLSFVSLIMVVLLYLIWRRSFQAHRAMTWAMAAIIGGALGNFVDRFRLKEVVDFIAVKIPLIGRIFPRLGDPYDFPIFNIADASAVCGTLALAIYLASLDYRHARRRRQAAKSARAAFQPFPEGPLLDTAAIGALKRQAAQGRRWTAIGLTRHHATPQDVPGEPPAAEAEGGGDGS